MEQNKKSNSNNSDGECKISDQSSVKLDLNKFFNKEENVEPTKEVDSSKKEEAKEEKVPIQVIADIDEEEEIIIQVITEKTPNSIVEETNDNSDTTTDE